VPSSRLRSARWPLRQRNWSQDKIVNTENSDIPAEAARSHGLGGETVVIIILSFLHPEVRQVERVGVAAKPIKPK